MNPIQNIPFHEKLIAKPVQQLPAAAVTAHHGYHGLDSFSICFVEIIYFLLFSPGEFVVCPSYVNSVIATASIPGSPTR